MNKILHSEKGYTLIELLAVVAIVGIIVAVAATSGIGSWLGSSKVSSDAEKLVSDLRLLQSKAQARQNNMQFTAAADGQSYTIDGSTVQLSKGDKISSSGGPLTFQTDGTKSGTGVIKLIVSDGNTSKEIDINEQGLIELKN